MKSKNPYETRVKKEPNAILEIGKNYRICRRIDQSLFTEIADSVIQYINTLSPYEIDQLDDNIRSNGWGVQSIVEIKNSVELLCLFQMFHYLNWRFQLTNGLLPVPDGKTPEGSKKISMKTLYELFKDKILRACFFSIFIDS